jgi:hypothetical protein
VYVELEDLLKKGAGEALRQYDEKGSDWFDKLVGRARDYVEAETRIDRDGPAGGTRKATLDSLTKLEEHKADLLHLGSFGLVDLLAQISMGRTNEAVLTYLRETATLEELLAASEASDEALLARSTERKQAFKKGLAVVKEIGSLTARYVLAPLLQGLAAGLFGGK